MPSLRLSAGVAASPEPSDLQPLLESLVAQGRPFDQVVLAYSAQETSPETLALLKRYESSIQPVLVPPGLTPAQHWNLLAPHLTGDWISFFTPDDCARPNFVREVELTVSATPTAAILRAGWISTRDNGRPGETYTLHSVRSVVHPPEALYEQRFGPKGSFSAAAIRSDIWHQAGLFPAETPLLGDWAMWLLAGALGDTIRSREVIGEHRTRQQSTSADALRKTSEINEAYLIYRDILPRAAALAGLHEPTRKSSTLNAPTWIAAASRKRFRDIAIATSSRFGSALRGPLVDALRPWAAAVDQQQLLQRLEAGERIRDFNLARRVKPALRRIISAVR